MNTEQNTNQTPQSNGQVNNTPVMQATVQSTPIAGENPVETKTDPMEMIEFSNDITESKGVLTDDTTTKPQDDFSDKTIGAVNKLINTTDYTSYFGTEEVKKYKLYATLCYIPLVALYFKYINK